METFNNIDRQGLVHRAVAFAMALGTTAVVATALAVVFAGGTQANGTQLTQTTVAPVSAVLGG
jgi:hypothetical protein